VLQRTNARRSEARAVGGEERLQLGAHAHKRGQCLVADVGGAQPHHAQRRGAVLREKVERGLVGRGRGTEVDASEICAAARHRRDAGLGDARAAEEVEPAQLAAAGG
jgi:hypothetical protein